MPPCRPCVTARSSHFRPKPSTGWAPTRQHAAAVQKVFALKGRPPAHPLIVHLDSARFLHRWARDVPDSAATARRALLAGSSDAGAAAGAGRDRSRDRWTGLALPCGFLPIQWPSNCSGPSAAGLPRPRPIASGTSAPRVPSMCGRNSAMPCRWFSMAVNARWGSSPPSYRAWTTKYGCCDPVGDAGHSCAVRSASWPAGQRPQRLGFRDHRRRTMRPRRHCASCRTVQIERAGRSSLGGGQAHRRAGAATALEDLRIRDLDQHRHARRGLRATTCIRTCARWTRRARSPPGAGSPRDERWDAIRDRLTRALRSGRAC